MERDELSPLFPMSLGLLMPFLLPNPPAVPPSSTSETPFPPAENPPHLLYLFFFANAHTQPSFPSPSSPLAAGFYTLSLSLSLSNQGPNSHGWRRWWRRRRGLNSANGRTKAQHLHYGTSRIFFERISLLSFISRVWQHGYAKKQKKCFPFASFGNFLH